MIDNRNLHVALCWTSERLTASDHLINHYAEAEDICACIGRFTLRLLRRHVSSGPQDRARAGVVTDGHRHRIGICNCLLAFGQLRKSEIKYLHETIAHEPVRTEHYVFWFDVPMND